LNKKKKYFHLVWVEWNSAWGQASPDLAMAPIRNPGALAGAIAKPHSRVFMSWASLLEGDAFFMDPKSVKSYAFRCQWKGFWHSP